MTMEDGKQIFQQLNLKNIDKNKNGQDKWVKMEGGDEICVSISIDSSLEDSTNSRSSISSSDLEDASSSTSCSSSSSASSSGPLYELSELMAQLPIKRGLSKFCQGKSQSFTSLASVTNIEDLSKKKGNTPHYNRVKMKSCKSYGAGLDIGHKYSYSPKATI